MSNLMVPEITQEECAEVIQAISKVLRFGLNQHHPETGVTNIEALAIEVGQLKYMLDRLWSDWNLPYDTVLNAYYAKGNSLKHWAAFKPE